MKHVLVTGGAGFIGSHLCDALLARGYAVTALDNLITGRESNLDGAREAGAAAGRFSFVRADVSEPWVESDLPLISKFGLHGVLHFACPASPVDFDRIPEVILRVDSIGTFNTVDLALKYGARYVLASTSEIYGDPLEHPQKETYWGNVNTIGPRACYDEAKRFGEAVVSTATRLKGLRGGIVRVFNTYGPRMRLDDGRVVPELARQVLSDTPLTIHGSGLQTRSFCFVSDLVEGILRLFESAVTDPVNCGNPIERTILEFADAMQKAAKKSLPVRMLPGRQDDPHRRCPDITRAKTLLGWSPQVSLEEGLERTLASFREDLAK